MENTDDREFDVVPSRLRRPGSVVLEIDDEDPIFEHLDYAPSHVTSTSRARPASSQLIFGGHAAAGSLYRYQGLWRSWSATRSHRVGQGFESP